MHTCECGATFADYNGWNNINKIVRCEDCEIKRTALIAQINEAVKGKQVEMVYVSRTVSHLLTCSDFSFEISPRKAEKMNGQAIQVVEA